MGAENDTAVFWNRTMKRRTAKWCYGIVAGFIGGFSGTVKSTIALMVFAPDTFNIHQAGKTLGVALAIGVMHGVEVACAYMMKNPLPPLAGDTGIVAKASGKDPDGHLR